MIIIVIIIISASSVSSPRGDSKFNSSLVVVDSFTENNGRQSNLVQTFLQVELFLAVFDYELYTKNAYV